MLYVELDDVQARIAETEAGSNGSDSDAKWKAAEARVRASCSAQELGEAGAVSEVPEERSEQVKAAYREAAKRIHPDLAEDEDERARRASVMVEVNLAYEAGDESRLRRVLEEWDTRPESVKGDGLPAELVRLIRQIAHVERRLLDIDTEFEEIRISDLHRLKQASDAAATVGRDLLTDMAQDLKRQIREAGKRFDELIAARNA